LKAKTAGDKNLIRRRAACSGTTRNASIERASRFTRRIAFFDRRVFLPPWNHQDAIMREAFDWLKPAPLRQADQQDFRQADFFQPQLLEFRSDDFMDLFLDAVAQPANDALQAAVAVAAAPQQPLKLYQPVHGCFYLVCASLGCRQPGFPDRAVNLDEGETAFFVLRKFIAGAEYAWTSVTGRPGWQPVPGGVRQVLPGEERLPLLKTRTGDQRDLWFGYLPVAGRETYAVSPSELADSGTPPLDVRLEELGARFITPLTVRNAPPAIAGGPLETALSATQSVDPQQARNLSVYLLLGLWEFFDIWLPEVAVALRDAPAPVTFTGDQAAAQTALLAMLQTEPLNGTLTLAAALGEVARQRTALDQLGDGDLAALGFDNTYNLATVAAAGDPNGLTLRLRAAVAAALPGQTAPPLELPKFVAARQPAQTGYAVRCVYERPQCEPVVQTLSQPSAPFRLAAYFDADAPARPVRIPLPSDVSLASLRKFNKGVTFLISNSLQKKINRLTGKEKTLLDDNPDLNPEQDDGLAFICSFSIQIIFIIAFLLLLVFVIIFNLVFWWLPFFRICLPVPKRLLSG
jgi:hypothetical protein